MTKGEQLALAARSFIGAPFRLYGRDPDTGLDCVGLLVVSLNSIGIRADPPSGYRLRNSAIDRWLGHLHSAELIKNSAPIQAGDVLLVYPGPRQYHFMIADGSSQAIHAHAGLRRVVRQPILAGLNLVTLWRLAS